MTHYQYRHNILLCFFAVCSIISGCAKQEADQDSIIRSNTLESLRKPVPSGYTLQSLSAPPVNDIQNTFNSHKRNDVNPTGSGGRPKVGSYKFGAGEVKPIFNSNDNKDYLFFIQKYKSQMFTIADQSMALNIYPGAILDGRSIEGIFEPKMLLGISNNIRPITISTSMPVSGSAVAKTSLPRPIAERALYNAALTDLAIQNPEGIGATTLHLDLDSFTVYEELKTIYGYNKGINAFLYNSSSVKKGDNYYISAKSAVSVKFLQENFTIDVDVPNTYNELFDPTGLDLQAVTHGVTPVYVKSVTYGRMGIMVIESTATAEKLYNAVNKQKGILLNLIGVDNTLTQEEKDILNSAEIKVKYTGVGLDSDKAIKVNGLSGFIEVLTANNTYSKESPGIPVAFQLSYLDNDHGLVEAPFQINYGPFQKPYVRIEYRNSKEEVEPRINPRFTDSDIYIAFYRDENAQIPYGDISIFVPYKYKVTTQYTEVTNWTPNYHTTVSDEQAILKVNTPKHLLMQQRVYYYVKYGSEARTSKVTYRYDMLPSPDYHALSFNNDVLLRN